MPLAMPKVGDRVALPASAGAAASPTYQLDCFLGRGAFGSVFRARPLADQNRGSGNPSSNCGEGGGGGGGGKNDDPVALKIVWGVDSAVFTMLVREIACLHRLGRHGNIVLMKDAWCSASKGSLVIALEYLAGGDLKQYLAQRRQRHQRPAKSGGPAMAAAAAALPLEEAVHFGRQVAAGMLFIWRRGLVHRDLKPANCLLSAPEPGATLKIADFGFARQLDSGTGSSYGGGGGGLATSQVGTPTYAAPEMALGCFALRPTGEPWAGGPSRGSTPSVGGGFGGGGGGGGGPCGKSRPRQKSGPPPPPPPPYCGVKADVWSLGVVLFELVAGAPPHTGKNPNDQVARALSGRLVVPKAAAWLVRDACPLASGLAALFQGLLHPDPLRRFGPRDFERATNNPFVVVVVVSQQPADDAQPVDAAAAASAATGHGPPASEVRPTTVAAAPAPAPAAPVAAATTAVATTAAVAAAALPDPGKGCVEERGREPEGGGHPSEGAKGMATGGGRLCRSDQRQHDEGGNGAGRRRKRRRAPRRRSGPKEETETETERLRVLLECGRAVTLVADRLATRALGGGHPVSEEEGEVEEEGKEEEGKEEEREARRPRRHEGGEAGSKGGSGGRDLGGCDCGMSWGLAGAAPSSLPLARVSPQGLATPRGGSSSGGCGGGGGGNGDGGSGGGNRWSHRRRRRLRLRRVASVYVRALRLLAAGLAVDASSYAQAAPAAPAASAASAASEAETQGGGGGGCGGGGSEEAALYEEEAADKRGEEQVVVEEKEAGLASRLSSRCKRAELVALYFEVEAKATGCLVRAERDKGPGAEQPRPPPPHAKQSGEESKRGGPSDARDDDGEEDGGDDDNGGGDGGRWACRFLACSAYGAAKAGLLLEWRGMDAKAAASLKLASALFTALLLLAPAPAGAGAAGGGGGGGGGGGMEGEGMGESGKAGYRRASFVVAAEDRPILQALAMACAARQRALLEHGGGGGGGWEGKKARAFSARDGGQGGGIERRSAAPSEVPGRIGLSN